MESENIPRSLLDLKFKIYTYNTRDYEPGTIIVHPDLTNLFDTQLLFDMEKVTTIEISLEDILHKGFIKIGNTDLMENMDIEYPILQNNKYPSRRIIGKHMDVGQSAIMRTIPDCKIDYELKSNLNMDYDSDSDSNIYDNIYDNTYDNKTINTYVGFEDSEDSKDSEDIKDIPYINILQKDYDNNDDKIDININIYHKTSDINSIIDDIHKENLLEDVDKILGVLD